MKIKVPYYRQKRDYFCGAASLQMLMSFFGKFKSQKELAKMTGLTLTEIKKNGINNEKMIEAARNSKFFVYVNSKSNLEEIKYYINLKLPVLVNYIEPSDDQGHFAVISGYNRFTKSLTLNDPWNGKNFKLDETVFLARWHSGFEKHGHWLMIISKKSFDLGRQYEPLKIKKRRD